MKKKYLNYFTITIAFIFIFLFKYIEIPNISTDAKSIIGIFIGTLILWIWVSIDWPSLLCIIMLGLIPNLGFKYIFASSFGNDTFLFLLFTFALTSSIAQTQIINKISVAFLTSSFAKKGPWYLAFSFFTCILILGAFISPTVLFFIIFPILENIFSILKLEKKSTYASMMTIGLIACVSISAGMTPISHIFPVIVLRIFEENTNFGISNLQYMMFAIPSGILIFLSLFASFRFTLKNKIENFDNQNISELKNSLSIKLDKKEKIILSVFLFIILIWILPSFIKIFNPEIAALISKQGLAAPPLLGLLILSIIRLNGEKIIVLEELFKKGVAWVPMILIAATLSLSSALTNPDIGITNMLISNLKIILVNKPAFPLIIGFVLWAALQSHVSSHIVTAQIVSTIAIPIALASPYINEAPLACMIALAASMGFATPSSMPYVAISIGSNWTDSKTVLKYGMLTMLSSIVILVFISYPLANIFF